MIGKLLGHTQMQTTARYAHLTRDSIQTAAALITQSIGAIWRTAMNPIKPICRVLHHRKLKIIPLSTLVGTARQAPTRAATEL